MHTIWSGDIAFGLVTIPTKLYAATRDLSPKFHLVHKGCGVRIEMVRRCPKHEKDLAWEEIEKAYEVAKGEFAPITKEELAEVENKEAKGVIELVEFVDPAEVDWVYIEKSYWVGPSGRNGNSFALLRDVLQKSGQVAVGKVAIRSRPRLAILRPRDRFFSLDTMRFADELVPVKEMVDVPAKTPSDREMTLAQTLVDQLKGPFDPEKHPDDYRARIEALVEAKVEAHQTQKSAPADRKRGGAETGGSVIDLSELLARSLNGARGPGPAKAKKTPVAQVAPAAPPAKRRRGG